MMLASTLTRGRRMGALAFVLLIGGLPAEVASANHEDGAGQSYTTLQAPFTQDLFGIGPEFFGGVAFAPDGDPLVDFCQFNGSSLRRFDRQGVESPDPTGSELHPSSLLPSSAGCGLSNHPDGTLYTNTGVGVVNLDANTGAVLRGGFGPPGDALGIATDPQTNDLVYVGNDGTLRTVNQAFTTTGVFSSATTGIFIDGIAFDPPGDFLFIADRSNDALKVIDRTGAIVNSVPLTVGFDPDGIAFKATAPKFVVSNNGDGTITRYDFPGDDYTQTPTQSLLAGGGFRGDLSQVGPDGCLYVTQAGTRFDDGTVSSANSLVRICPGFAPPPGAGTEGPPGDPTCSDGIDNDGDGDVDGADSDCQVPNEDPDCSGVKADPKLLWPPNHKFQLVTLDGATDPDGDPVTLTITGVTQDEPLNGLGDGDTSPDAKAGPAPNKVYVRAERSGTGDGRVYRIAFTVTDGNGGSCTGTATVGVPHDQGKGSTPIDSGPTVNSFGP